MDKRGTESLPLVTVITVTYNSEIYVKDAIESVLNQSYSNLEYIIGDDCSTDGTWNIINSYNDARIIRYRNETNLREYSNRNKAISLAKGKYLIFIDGDDVIYFNGIETFVNFIEQYPEVAFLVQKGYTNNIIYPIVLDPENLVRNYFLGRKNLLTSSFASNFFNTSLLKAAGGLSEFYKSGDEEIRLRLSIRYPVLFISGWYSWPRETPGQASARISRTVALLEHERLSCEISSHKEISKIDYLAMDIIKTSQRKIVKLALRYLASFKLGKMVDLLMSTRFNLFELIASVRYRVINEDIVSKYSPVNPLKHSR